MSADPRLTALVRAHLANMDEVKRLEAELAAAKMREEDGAHALWDVVLGDFDRDYLLTDNGRYLVFRAEYIGSATRVGPMLHLHIAEPTLYTSIDEPPVRVEGLSP